ncbi:beta-N-acetylhexosaminidase [Lutibacter sp. A64]|uniref:beta-N-acetylhexosaminidase n=1 Tax=Lutibacter sp. A64 TaxID=2918526 RepID=UPI001F05E253|nr:beta-N-acetylhexosaminidase [Lutibacter sp. A64]UMB55289.1 beta-N-acetylhexosaminidase [Lutibacter sp. A64]
MMHIKLFNQVFFFFSIILITSCSGNPQLNLSEAVLFPKPVSVSETGSSFELNAKTKIFVTNDSEELLGIGNSLVSILNPATGFNLAVETGSETSKSNSIYLKISDLDTKFGSEGYKLTISEKNIVIESVTVEGVFRAIQTLRQLLSDEIESTQKQEKQWFIASGEIEDYPEYAYRGAMLDVARHFFGVEDVKRYIDLLAAYKINILHLHLSDDQGWRIEIKSWPKLTTIGGSTEVGGGEGGFYTQEQYKEIVAYAAANYITVIPEIDMPGHTNAALASYPELNCDGKSPELYTGIKVGFSTLCTSKEITYKFIDDVVKELVALTPGPYIHIGGDESHVTDMEDYIPFINRVQDIVNSYNKTVIGWDEIAHADLKNEAIVQFWAKEENAKKGVAQNSKVIVSPSTKTYLDMKYDSLTNIGLNWAGYIELDSAYLWTPDTFIKGVKKENILGIESPLWTETITTMDDIEYMVFPRIIGHSEIGWTPTSLRNWEDYKERLIKHTKRLKLMDVNYYDSKLLSE